MAGEHSYFEDLVRQRENEPGFAEAYEAAQRAGELGMSVVKLRKQRGWSQKQLAKAAGMTESAIDDLELGGPIPTFSELERVAKALGTKLDVQFLPRDRSEVG